MYAIDEHLGSMAKLRELIDKAHALGCPTVLPTATNRIMTRKNRKVCMTVQKADIITAAIFKA